MKALDYSFIVPVFNRPEEIRELLVSFTKLEGNFDYEIVIVEDGSTNDSKSLVDVFKKTLNISYLFKENSGPGDSRNFGMRNAKGNYFIILDSDCLLPKNYLTVVNEHLTKNFVDCYGGVDTAHESFTNLQKAINFSMTSNITTGGIRGRKTGNQKFQPRSFNMGLSKPAFDRSGGFGVIHPGEDPDLSIRLHKLGFETRCIPEAIVYHKRRISWSKFFKQVHKFGMVRPILNFWYPETRRLAYWFPSFFSLGLVTAFVLSIWGFHYLAVVYGLYFLVAFVLALVGSKNISVAFQAMVAILVQFMGYGFGFFRSTILIEVFGKNPEKQFPHLFFKHVD